MSRCSGQCCRSFSLPVSPERIAEGLTHLKRFNTDPEYRERYMKGEEPAKFTPEDGEVLLPMLVSIVEAFPGDPHPTDTGAMITMDHTWYYTCVHFDDRTGNCGIYDRRPRMCRDYPYGTTCQYNGCTMDPRCTVESVDGERCTKRAGHPPAFHSWDHAVLSDYAALAEAVKAPMAGSTINPDEGLFEKLSEALSEQTDQVTTAITQESGVMGEAHDPSHQTQEPQYPHEQQWGLWDRDHDTSATERIK